MRLVFAVWALLASTALQPAVDAPAGQTIRRHYSPADRERGRYHYVPFDVPPGTVSLTIAYEYDGKDGASVIDLGVFEPGPLSLGSASFRGYSGGAQRTVTIGREAASPGYRAGELPAGRWHVLLGLYKVADGGVDVRIEVTARREPAAGGEPRWYAGALHLHTTHSDGAVGPRAVSDLARAAGLDFIAITDHNNTVHAREAMPSSPLAIVGEEVTTPAGHASVWGLQSGSFIDFRVGPGDPGAAQTINALAGQAHAAGALFSINHPFGDCGGCWWGQVVPDELDAIEIWNGETGPQDQAVALWDRMLQSGRQVTAVAASDWHRPPARIDVPSVRVAARELSEAAILDGIRRGRVIVMRDAAAPPPSLAAGCGGGRAGVGGTLTCTAGETMTIDAATPGVDAGQVHLVWNGEVKESRQAAGGVRFAMPASAGYLRLRVDAAGGGVLAITNPVHVVLR